MQDVLLNDDPKEISFEEVSKIYAFNENALILETSIFNRMYKASNNKDKMQSRINYLL